MRAAFSMRAAAVTLLVVASAALAKQGVLWVDGIPPEDRLVSLKVRAIGNATEVVTKFEELVRSMSKVTRINCQLIVFRRRN